jgi:hypothetical protein
MLLEEKSRKKKKNAAWREFMRNLPFEQWSRIRDRWPAALDFTQ